MNKEEIARIVRAESNAMLAANRSGPYDGYIVNPLHLLYWLEERRPDVVQHIRRHYRCDPYQQLKVWVPRGLGR